MRIGLRRGRRLTSFLDATGAVLDQALKRQEVLLKSATIEIRASDHGGLLKAERQSFLLSKKMRVELQRVAICKYEFGRKTEYGYLPADNQPKMEWELIDSNSAPLPDPLGKDYDEPWPHNA
jgi:hypothetical protein